MWQSGRVGDGDGKMLRGKEESLSPASGPTVEPRSLLTEVEAQRHEEGALREVTYQSPPIRAGIRPAGCLA